MGEHKISWKQISLVFGPLLFFVCLIIPTPYQMVEAAYIVSAPYSWAPKYALGVLLWVAVWWIGECAPLGLSALLPAILFGISGILDWKSALTCFADPLIWIFMAGFTFAKAFKVWSLDKRIALRLATIHRTKNPILMGFFIACLPAFLLSVSGSITASASIVYALVLAFLVALGFNRGSQYGETTLLALAQASTAGAMLFLTSTPPNLIAKRVIMDTTGVNLTFFDWFIVGTPHALIGLFLVWIVSYFILKPEVKTLPFGYDELKRQYKSLGPMKKGEKIILVLLAITMALWIFPGMLDIVASVNPALKPISDRVSKLIPEAAPAVLVIFLFPLLRAGGRPLLTWREIMVEGMNWDALFLLGGGLALGAGLGRSGFAMWIGLLFKQFIGGGYWSICALSALMGFLMTYPATNTGSAAVSCPMVATIAISAGLNPIPPVIITALACSISSALPSTTPPMAIVYGSGYVRVRSMFKLGMICDILRLILLIMIGPILGYFLLSIKGIA